jgi:hypothetical protein
MFEALQSPTNKVKKHSLEEHINDVWDWRHTAGPKLKERLAGCTPEKLFSIAYERWSDDKPLLTEEDK